MSNRRTRRPPSSRPRPINRFLTAPASGVTPKAVVRMSGPGDVLDVVPHLFGFVPSESLVLIGLCGDRHRLGPTMRMDLADGPGRPAAAAQSLADEAVGVITRQPSTARPGPLTQVIAIVYTDEGDPDPLSRLPHVDLLEEIRRRFGELDVSVRDALVVRHGRWWSIDCDDPGCCPPEGTPVHREVPSSAGMAMEMELGAPQASRAELEASVAADVPEGLAEEVVLLTEELRTVSVGSRVGQALDVQDHAIDTVDRGGRLDPAVLALLIALAQETTTRDMLVMALEREQVPSAVHVWTQLLAACPAPFDAQVGAILGLLAWEIGRGALARCACERVFATDPDHSLTRLIERGISYGIPAPERMSPEQLPVFLAETWGRSRPGRS